MAELEAGMPGSSGVVGSLLRDPSEIVAVRAAEVCRNSGVRASSLRNRLVDCLRHSDSWLVQAHAAVALGNIGKSSPEAVEAMWSFVCNSDVPRLRGDCTRALAKLGELSVARILTVFEQKAFVKDAYAVDALAGLGNKASDDLLNALAGDRRLAEIARLALRRMGWRIVDRLENAGHAALATDILTHTPLEALAFGDGYQVAEVVVPRVASLHQCTWVIGDECTRSLRLYRGWRDAGTYRIDCVNCYEADGRARLTFESASVDWYSARAAIRQVATISGTTVCSKSEVMHGMGYSSTVECRMISIGGVDGDIAAAFIGSATSTNVVERFRSEASTRVMTQLLDGSSWVRREPTDADRQCVEKVVDMARQANEGDAAWVVALLAGIYNVRIDK